MKSYDVQFASDDIHNGVSWDRIRIHYPVCDSGNLWTPLFDMHVVDWR